jgi:large subunit ribosomal protein L22
VIATAKLRYLGVSAQKTRLVVDQLRGKNVNDALAILRYSRKLVAKDLQKLVQSAVANAQQKDPSVDIDRLFVAQAQVDTAPPMKRARAQSMGRIFPVIKRACHVTVALDVPSKEERE